MALARLCGVSSSSATNAAAAPSNRTVNRATRISANSKNGKPDLSADNRRDLDHFVPCCVDFAGRGSATLFHWASAYRTGRGTRLNSKPLSLAALKDRVVLVESGLMAESIVEIRSRSCGTGTKNTTGGSDDHRCSFARIFLGTIFRARQRRHGKARHQISGGSRQRFRDLEPLRRAGMADHCAHR